MMDHGVAVTHKSIQVPKVDNDSSSSAKFQMTDIDQILSASLRQLAEDPHVLAWSAKERNWVNYFALRHLLSHCRPDGCLRDPSQVALEVAVPQPPGYEKRTVNRDLVIWAEGGATCWDQAWEPARHPLAILEWKVHRPGHRNNDVSREREWLRRYCAWRPETLGYAVEVDWTPAGFTMNCHRFEGKTTQSGWLDLVAPRA